MGDLPAPDARGDRAGELKGVKGCARGRPGGTLQKLFGSKLWAPTGPRDASMCITRIAIKSHMALTTATLKLVVVITIGRKDFRRGGDLGAKEQPLVKRDAALFS